MMSDNLGRKHDLIDRDNVRNSRIGMERGGAANDGKNYVSHSP